MRLFLSAETVRRVRIILLRATHIPFVTLIWIYESKWRKSVRQNRQFTPVSTRGRTSANEPSSRFRDPPFPFVQVVATNVGPGKQRSVDQKAAHEPSAGGQQVQLADLIDTVERLRAQVEALTAQK